MLPTHATVAYLKEPLRAHPLVPLLSVGKALSNVFIDVTVLIVVDVGSKHVQHVLWPLYHLLSLVWTARE